jgi:hypothetical protein
VIDNGQILAARLFWPLTSELYPAACHPTARRRWPAADQASGILAGLGPASRGYGSDSPNRLLGLMILFYNII